MTQQYILTSKNVMPQIQSLIILHNVQFT